MSTEEKMTVDERRKYLRLMKKRYVKANRKERGRLLDEMEAVLGIHRKSLIRLMSGDFCRETLAMSAGRLVSNEEARTVRCGRLLDLYLGDLSQRPIQGLHVLSYTAAWESQQFHPVTFRGWSRQHDSAPTASQPRRWTTPWRSTGGIPTSAGNCSSSSDTLRSCSGMRWTVSCASQGLSTPARRGLLIRRRSASPSRTTSRRRSTGESRRATPLDTTTSSRSFRSDSGDTSCHRSTRPPCGHRTFDTHSRTSAGHPTRYDAPWSASTR